MSLVFWFLSEDTKLILGSQLKKIYNEDEEYACIEFACPFFPGPYNTTPARVSLGCPFSTVMFPFTKTYLNPVEY
jgi:hypothetical protein